MFQWPFEGWICGEYEFEVKLLYSLQSFILFVLPMWIHIDFLEVKSGYQKAGFFEFQIMRATS
jgi:hypothetical protein